MTFRSLTAAFAAAISAAVFIASPAEAVQIPVAEDTYTSDYGTQGNQTAGSNQNGYINGASSHDRKVWLKFGLGCLPENTHCFHVRKATLRIYVADLPSAGTLEVYAAGGTWAETTLSHNNAPSLLGDPTNGSAYASASLSTGAQYIVLDVTELVRDWVDGTRTNFGLVLKGSTSLSGQIDMKENTSASHSATLDVETGFSFNQNGDVVLSDLTGNPSNDIVLSPGTSPFISIGGNSVLTSVNLPSALSVANVAVFTLIGGLAGPTATATGRSIAVGRNASATHWGLTNSYAIGDNSFAESGGLSLGNNARGEGNFNLAMGYHTYAKGTGSVALGFASAAYCVETPDSSNIAVGTSAQALGYYSIIFGSGLAKGYQSVAIGRQVEANGSNQFVLGRWNDPLSTIIESDTSTFTDSNLTFILGNGYQLTDGSVVKKNAMTIRRDDGAAIGTGVQSNGPSQFVAGRYNDLSTAKQSGVFVVGMGTGTAPAERKNAIRVLESGAVLIQPSGDISMGEFTAGEQP